MATTCSVTTMVLFVMLSIAPLRIQTQSQSQEPVRKVPTRVLIAGSGSPSYVQTVLDDLTDFLTSKGVSIRQADAQSKSRDSYIDQLTALGAESLLYVSVDIGVGQPSDHIKVDCFDREGKKLWHEDVGMFFRGTPKKLAKAMSKKLEAHLGKDGLPVGPK